MADLFANATLKAKLTGIIMLVCSIVLLLSSVAYIGAQVFSFRKIMIENSASLAEVIAANSAISLVFQDSELAQNTLEALASEPKIQLAFIFDRNHKPFARYYRRKNLSGEGQNQRPVFTQEELAQLARGIQAQEKSHQFSRRHLATFCPVYFEGNLVGTVYLSAEMSPLYNWLVFFAGVGFVVVGVSFLLAYLLSLRLQDLVSRPILYLVDKMNLVKTEEDFTIRATKSSDDEVGTLVDGFNGMLARVEERDCQLERYRLHLEDLVYKRTAELHLANDKLQQTIVELEKAKTKIEAASSAKSQFLASISHELRTPMVGVLGTAELLLDSDLDRDQRSLVETLNDSGEGLLTLLNDLLDLSKIEAGKIHLEKIDFNLLEVIETPLQLLANNACEKDLELLCHCEPHVPLDLRGDPGRLRQVIFNLIGNAIKFTPSGEVVLFVTAEQEQATEVCLRFEVRDTGVGIAREAQEAIFEAFRQADNSVTREFGGTGLGLSIVRQLVDKMGGQVGLHSLPGKGSVFHVTLALEKQEKATASVREIVPDASGKRVLIVEDNRSACSMLQERFAARGFEVEIALDSESAATKLRDAFVSGRLFDAVMLDAGLAEEGKRRLAGLLVDSHSSGVRVIAMQCRGGASVSGMAGICASMYKPLLPTMIDESIARILQWSDPSSVKEAAKSGGSGKAVGPRGGKEEKGRGRILVAEDNPTTQNLLKISLGSIGFEVVIAADGREALDISAESSFDLVLLDFNMPELDGCAVARQLRAEGWKSPIVGLTAHTSENYVIQCKEAGMDDCLSKPFKQKNLHQVVAKWLGELDFPGSQNSSR